MSKTTWKIIFILIVLFGVWLWGFYVGRKTIKPSEPKVVVEYIKGDTIHDTISYPVPYKVIEPIDTVGVIEACVRDGVYVELWPANTITEYVVVTKEDTTAIIQDWGTKRMYKEEIFDIDTVGTCVIDAEVQYNRLRFLSYEYTPVSKEVTIEEPIIKAFSPFVGCGVMINPWDDVKDPMAQLSAGAFIKEKYGVQLQYQHAMKSKNDYIGGTFLYKF